LRLRLRLHLRLGLRLGLLLDPGLLGSGAARRHQRLARTRMRLLRLRRDSCLTLLRVPLRRAEQRMRRGLLLPRRRAFGLGPWPPRGRRVGKRHLAGATGAALRRERRSLCRGVPRGHAVGRGRRSLCWSLSGGGAVRKWSSPRRCAPGACGTGRQRRRTGHRLVRHRRARQRTGAVPALGTLMRFRAQRIGRYGRGGRSRRVDRLGRPRPGRRQRVGTYTVRPRSPDPGIHRIHRVVHGRVIRRRRGTGRLRALRRHDWRVEHRPGKKLGRRRVETGRGRELGLLRLRLVRTRLEPLRRTRTVPVRVPPVPLTTRSGPWCARRAVSRPGGRLRWRHLRLRLPLRLRLRVLLQRWLPLRLGNAPPNRPVIRHRTGTGRRACHGTALAPARPGRLLPAEHRLRVRHSAPRQPRRPVRSTRARLLRTTLRRNGTPRLPPRETRTLIRPAALPSRSQRRDIVRGRRIVQRHGAQRPPAPRRTRPTGLPRGTVELTRTELLGAKLVGAAHRASSFPKSSAIRRRPHTETGRAPGSGGPPPAAARRSRTLPASTDGPARRSAPRTAPRTEQVLATPRRTGNHPAGRAGEGFHP
jgi:hypothetical protein